MELSTHWVLSPQPQPDADKPSAGLWSSLVFATFVAIGETEVMGGALVSQDEKIAWKQDAHSSSASTLSCLDSGVDVTLTLCPTPTPSCSGSTLGVPLRG